MEKNVSILCPTKNGREIAPKKRLPGFQGVTPESGFINWLYAVPPWGGILRNAVHRNGS